MIMRVQNISDKMIDYIPCYNKEWLEDRRPIQPWEIVQVSNNYAITNHSKQFIQVPAPEPKKRHEKLWTKIIIWILIFFLWVFQEDIRLFLLKLLKELF